MSEIRVEVARGGEVESVHTVDAAVVAEDRIVAAAGAPSRVVFARSAVKPFQALPLVQDGVLDGFGLGPEALAVACASHSGEPRHVEVVRSVLDAIGLPESALACGPHEPFADAARDALRARGLEPGRIHNNCSGKHAGMLALAAAHGWPTEGYQEAGHPVQDRMLKEMTRWTGLERSELRTAVDGCGVVTFAMPLAALARAFARLASSAGAGQPAPAAVVAAMTGHPFLVGGTDRLCTRLMEVTGGRIVAKVGAEGVYGAAVPDRGLGIALKTRDGARRAAEPALLGVLEDLGLLDSDQQGALREWARPVVRNTRGEAVGGVRAVVAWNDEGPGDAGRKEPRDG